MDQKRMLTILLLELSIVAAIVRFGRPGRLLLAGVVYLLAANFLGVLSMEGAIRSKGTETRGLPDAREWHRRRTGYVLLLFGWKIAILGWLNIQEFTFPRSLLSNVLGYLAVGVFVILSFKMVALADAAEQDGGSKPINFFGYPRTRRIFFLVFMYTPITPLIMMNLIPSNRNWLLLQLPHFWLLLLSLLSGMSAGLVFHRYRRVPANKSLKKKLLALTICVLGFTTILEITSAYDAWVYALSSITVACMAATVYWLLLAKEPSESSSAMTKPWWSNNP